MAWFPSRLGVKLPQPPSPMTTLLDWFRFALVAASLVLVSGLAQAQTQAGAIKAVRVSGEVTRIASSGAPGPVAEGQALIETDTIVTGRNSGVVLVFMNGSSVKLAAESRLAIEEFKMDPAGETIAVAALKEEPTTSKTRLNLAYGDLIGSVKKLGTSSRFDIRTPVGAAGIRGTTFRIVLRFGSDGRVAFTLSTAEGRVVFSGAVPAATSPTAPPSREIEVTAGNEVSAVVEVSPATNEVTAIQVSAPGPISAPASAAIDAAIESAIKQATESTTFTAAEQQQAADQTPPAISTEAGAEAQPANPPAPGTTTTPQVLDTTSRSPG